VSAKRPAGRCARNAQAAPVCPVSRPQRRPESGQHVDAGDRPAQPHLLDDKAEARRRAEENRKASDQREREADKLAEIEAATKVGAMAESVATIAPEAGLAGDRIAAIRRRLGLSSMTKRKPSQKLVRFR